MPASRPLPRLTVVCCTLVDGALAVLVTGSGAARSLPSVPVPETGSLEAAAESQLRALLGRGASWMSQAAAIIDDGLQLTIVAAVPQGSQPSDAAQWLGASRVAATLGPAAGASVRSALAVLRERLDREPVAFRLLGPSFTLSDLQQVYELLLERRLHKASFRRALLAAHLVEPTDTWKSEGRGRPAQLFRFSPRRRRGLLRPVRFELLS